VKGTIASFQHTRQIAQPIHKSAVSGTAYTTTPAARISYQVKTSQPPPCEKALHVASTTTPTQ